VILPPPEASLHYSLRQSAGENTTLALPPATLLVTAPTAIPKPLGDPCKVGHQGKDISLKARYLFIV